MLDTTTCLPFIAAGKMRALAVASKKRNPALPDVPDLRRGRPARRLCVVLVRADGAGRHAASAVIDKLNAEANTVLQSPEIKKRMADFGAEIGGGTPEDFDRFIGSEIKRYESIVRLSGAKLD